MDAKKIFEYASTHNFPYRGDRARDRAKQGSKIRTFFLRRDAIFISILSLFTYWRGRKEDRLCEMQEI